MFELELNQLSEQHLLRQITPMDACTGSLVTAGGNRALLMCSNDYLGLAAHPALKLAAVQAMERQGCGSGASRLVSGTSAFHVELERRIALFKGTEAALLFNSGYAANTGIIPAVAQEGDAILSDSLNHASIIDGCRLSGAAIHVFRHKNLDHLEGLLKNTMTMRRRLIVSDGVFSMDGDIASLPGLVFLAEKYGAILMVDDTHAIGVLGNTGRGSVEHFGLGNRVHIQMGTLGKALGSFGAYAAGEKKLIDYLMNTARTFMFSTSLPSPVCAASIVAFDVLENEPERRERLWSNRSRFVKGLEVLGISIGNSETPVIPILVGDSNKALQAGKELYRQGVYASAIRPPTVPENTSRIRTTMTSELSDTDIDFALTVFGNVKQEGLIPDGIVGQ